MDEPTDTQIRVPLSPGELLDKISILLIKQERIQDPEKQLQVRRELAALSAARDHSIVADEGLTRLAAELKAINESLWEIEDEIRSCESRAQFDQTFVSLARKVYQTNDRRAEIKRKINILTNAEFAEVKEYSTPQSY